MKLVLTCEHAGNLVPVKFSEHFFNFKKMLNTHRGYDLGAMDMFEYLNELADYHQFYSQTRLLIEVNRSLHHPNLFSEVTKSFSSEEKKKLIENYYLPYRNEVEEKVKNYLEEGEDVLHLSIHSFTPSLNGEGRTADIGLLYDPSRNQEKQFSAALKLKLEQQTEKLRVKMNYPYLGKADGFTTYLRKKFPRNYMGIEIEVNQKFVMQKKMGAGIKDIVYKALQQLV